MANLCSCPAKPNDPDACRKCGGITSTELDKVEQIIRIEELENKIVGLEEFKKRILDRLAAISDTLHAHAEDCLKLMDSNTNAEIKSAYSNRHMAYSGASYALEAALKDFGGRAPTPPSQQAT